MYVENVVKLNMLNMKIRNKKHLSYIRKLPYIIHDAEEFCNGTPIVAHHLTFVNDRGGVALKTGDNWTVPLCFFHHSALHNMGERTFWKTWQIDAEEEAKKLWEMNNASHTSRL